MLRSVIAALFGLAAFAAPAAAQTVKVGSKNFTEQYVVAEIYAQALEHAGIKVERRLNLGGTLIAQKAMTSGELDLYPEYTGTALLAVLKGKVLADPQQVFDEVKGQYEKQFQLTWLTPTKVNNGYAMIVRPETAARDKLTNLSSLAPSAKNLVIGIGSEFIDRYDGLPGLKEVYGVTFKDFKLFAKLGLRYDALAGKQVDMANGFATDWQIAENKLVVLADDKNLFPPYYLAPVVRQDTIAKQPKIAEVLNVVSPALDTETMRQLNAAVERDKEEPADVAKKWLTDKGFLK
jgi:osmoprotectant transport system substrate-binding protein